MKACKKIRLVISLLFLTVAFSCVDEYWPDLLPKYENLLVVDGTITNLAGPYTITLSQSSGLNKPVFYPLQKCEVAIADTKGNRILLTETEKGVYSTVHHKLRGICGESYRLEITRPDGREYRSAFERMALPTGIDTVYTKIKYKQHPVFYWRNITGFRFYIKTHRAENDSNYFLWKPECTYKFNANYQARYIFDGVLRPFHPPDSFYTCYKTNKIHNIFTYKTEDLSIPMVVDYPLHLVTTETKELSIRYSLLVQQYSLSREAYNFWNHISSIEQEQGALFTRQPFQVRGNVFNVDNPEEPVLGYFMVAGLSEKRIFINRPDNVNFYYQDSCNLYPLDRELLYQHYNEWPLLLPAVFSESGGQAAAWVDYQWCVDCTAKGADGYLEKPEFWID